MGKAQKLEFYITADELLAVFNALAALGQKNNISIFVFRRVIDDPSSLLPPKKNNPPQFKLVPMPSFEEDGFDLSKFLPNGPYYIGLSENDIVQNSYSFRMKRLEDKYIPHFIQMTLPRTYGRYRTPFSIMLPENASSNISTFWKELKKALRDDLSWMKETYALKLTRYGLSLEKDGKPYSWKDYLDLLKAPSQGVITNQISNPPPHAIFCPAFPFNKKAKTSTTPANGFVSLGMLVLYKTGPQFLLDGLPDLSGIRLEGRPRETWRFPAPVVA